MKQMCQLLGIKWCGALALLLGLTAGCASAVDEHPASYQYQAMPAGDTTTVDPCAQPNEGCSCANPGEVVDCGKVLVRVDNYETCYEGSRLCGKNGLWGACLADQAIVQLVQ